MALLPSLTELDAVNDMLMSIGQSPVNTLAVSDILDVSIARAELTKVIRSFQTTGFAFNTDENHTLSPDLSGIVALPTGWLKIDPVDRDKDYVARKHPNGAMALYDRGNQTWVITEPVICRVVWAYDYDALPPVAQQFAMTAAARKFSERVGHETQYNAEDEARAWTALQREDRSSRDTNLFTASPTLARAYRGYRRST